MHSMEAALTCRFIEFYATNLKYAEACVVVLQQPGVVCVCFIKET